MLGMSPKTRHNPTEIRTIRGYPETLKLFRMPASRYWYVRMYVRGGPSSGIKKSTRCEKFDDAKEFAISWYEDRLLEKRAFKDFESKSFSAYAEKFQENQKINLDKLLLPLSYNIAKDCLLRAENSNPTLLRAYPTVNAEAERFATTERAYRRVVTELVEKGLVQRSNQGLQVVDIDKLSDYVDSFAQL